MFLISKPIVPDSLAQFKPVSLTEIVTFRDTDHSRLIFLVDGIFLFLESFFWVVSLFLLAHESFARLGIMVLSLAVIFGVLFYLLKNSIDRLTRKHIYRFAVVLYALSWAIRALVDGEDPLAWIFVSLVLITFCTSFFRLAMNKRFYDLARETLSHRYLILKSYYSQAAIAVVFVIFGLIVLSRENSEQLLVPIYWIAAAASFVFLLYGTSRYDRTRVS